MADASSWSWEGIQLVNVVLGLVGAALGIGSMPPMTSKQCAVALGSGVIFAGYGPQWINFLWTRPWIPDWLNSSHTELLPFMSGSIAFICGVGGLFLVPGIIAFYRDPKGCIMRFIRFVLFLRLVKQGDIVPDAEQKEGTS